MADPARQHAPRHPPGDLPPGRTALVSMFPLRLDEPAHDARRAPGVNRPATPAQSPLTGGK